jgi:hypothetical protein
MVSETEVVNIANLQEYGLTQAFVQEGLAQIDTTKTVIAQYCPTYLRSRYSPHYHCSGVGRYWRVQSASGVN